ncbi:MAG: sulfite exporter TauE/SafE family protein [Deltaproteobacteria bacterium]|nr:sulfite exporter TauE/SafE family protein [Deltaproteobacteria bacterium]
MRTGAWVGLAGFVAAFMPEAHASADTLTELTAPFATALEGGSYLGALGLIFVAGLATSLTPCVYPMIAITVSVFGARKAESRARAALLSTSFVLGIAALFTPLGVVSALTGSAFGSALASPWVVGTLSALFAAMAFSMFGLFDLALPFALQNRLAQAGGFGLRGAFILGFVNGLIAAPCTGPVLAVLLTWVATTGNVAFGALALFIYAIGIGVLFWFVGTFAVTLPKSGRWVEWSKVVCCPTPVQRCGTRCGSPRHSDC